MLMKSFSCLLLYSFFLCLSAARVAFVAINSSCNIVDCFLVSETQDVRLFESLLSIPSITLPILAAILFCVMMLLVESPYPADRKVGTSVTRESLACSSILSREGSTYFDRSLWFMIADMITSFLLLR